MADADTVAAPAARKNADLPARLVSAVVMLAVAIGALVAGDPWLDIFIAAVVLAAFGEFVRLVWRATPGWSARLLGVAFGVAYMGLAALALTGLPVPLIVAIVGAVIFVDTFAYFAGRAIGGPRIAPAISPSKTWAGLGGAIAGAVLWLFLLTGTLRVALGTGGLPQWDRLDIVQILALGPMIAVAAQAGDFFESWLKRKAGVKDSSRLIPGHGGVFDRIDGMIPVALLAAFLLRGSL